MFVVKIALHVICFSIVLACRVFLSIQVKTVEFLTTVILVLKRLRWTLFDFDILLRTSVPNSAFAIWQRMSWDSKNLSLCKLLRVLTYEVCRQSFFLKETVLLSFSVVFIAHLCKFIFLSCFFYFFVVVSVIFLCNCFKNFKNSDWV